MAIREEIGRNTYRQYARIQSDEEVIYQDAYNS